MAEKQTNKERLKDITDSIEKGIQDLFQSDKYAEYLRTMSRFHRYSVSHKAMSQAQMQELTDKMERLEKSTQSTTEHGGAFIEKYKEYTELETLTGEIARDVVKRVTVHKDGGIEIALALRDELVELLNCLKAVDAAS